MKEIHCKCGKLLAKQKEDGTIVVWCKSCGKEVKLEVELYGSECSCKNG